MSGTTSEQKYIPLLTEGLTGGRGIDRGNATHSTVQEDFKRLGLTGLAMRDRNSRWTQPGGNDGKVFGALVDLRNVLAHGNDAELRRLLSEGVVRDSVSWIRGKLPVLNRYAKTLDRVVWDH